ncbi:hypothetical protein CTI14_71725, partial [Methylobacterium radiotolerans]
CDLPLRRQDYFPQIESSQMTLHIRTRPGERIEQAEKTCDLPLRRQDYFPQIESSQMTLHIRTRPGERIE